MPDDMPTPEQMAEMAVEANDPGDDAGQPYGIPEED